EEYRALRVEYGGARETPFRLCRPPALGQVLEAAEARSPSLLPPLAGGSCAACPRAKSHGSIRCRLARYVRKCVARVACAAHGTSVRLRARGWRRRGALEAHARIRTSRSALRAPQGGR